MFSNHLWVLVVCFLLKSNQMKEGFFLRLIGAAPRKAQTQTLSKKIRGISFEKQFICRVHSSKLCVIWLSWSDKNYLRTCVELGRRVNEKCFHKEERQDKGVERDRRERRGDSAGQGWSHLDLSQTDTCEGKIVVLVKVAEICFRVNQWRVLFQRTLWFGQNLCKTTHDMMKLAKTIRSENP